MGVPMDILVYTPEEFSRFQSVPGSFTTQSLVKEGCYMSDPVRELAEEWLVRAERDLRVARYLLTMPDPPPESVGFHAQQCAEKSLKSSVIPTLCP
jgi:hypothetical protein